MYKIEKIQLEGLANTRDLGGFLTKDGRRIKPCRLLRSGELYPATEADKKTLVEEYHLKTIVDFRDDMECEQHPDPVLPGVKHVRIPIFRQEALGITREEKESAGEPGKKDLMAGLLELAGSDTFDGSQYMAGLYATMVDNDYSLSQYGRFFQVLLEQEDGAVLWHCSAGKDRVGVGTALLLFALGVPEETIIKDYQMVNEFTRNETDAVMKMASDRVGESIVAKIHPFFCAEERFLRTVLDGIHAKFGSLENCLEKELGMTAQLRRQLQDMYLETADIQ